MDTFTILRHTGDIIHLITIVSLLCIIVYKKSCLGLSAKTQVLYTFVYATRYADVFSSFISYYNTSFKIIFFSVSFTIVMLMLLKYNKTYNKKYDKSRAEILLIMCLILAYMVNYYSVDELEIGWAFSQYLEAFALMPQICMLRRMSKSTSLDPVAVAYVYLMTTYRTFYIANWIAKYYILDFLDPISVSSGCAQIIFTLPLLIWWGIKLNLRDLIQCLKTRDDTKYDEIPTVSALSQVQPFITFNSDKPKPVFESHKMRNMEKTSAELEKICLGGNIQPV